MINLFHFQRSAPGSIHIFNTAGHIKTALPEQDLIPSQQAPVPGMFNRYLPKSEFARNVITLMTGTTIAQAIPVAISPILTRLYTPEDFGMLSLFMSFVTIIAVVASVRYELAIMLPKEEKDARNILVLSIIICTGISVLTLIAVVLFNQELARFMGDERIGAWLYWAPLTIFFMGIYQAFNFWSTRRKTFKSNAISRVSMATATGGTQLAAGYAGWGALGLIAGSIAGQVVSAVVIAGRSLRELFKHREEISADTMKSNMKRYRSFPSVNAPHALVDSLQDQGIIFLINYYFQATILGFYSFALRLLLAPVGLIGSSMNQVFFQKASHAFNSGIPLQPMVRAMYRRLLLVGLPLFTILFFILPWLFAFVFGEKWRPAGEIGQLLLPWVFLNFLISPVSSLPLIVNKQRQAMLFSFGHILIKLAALFIGGGYYKDFKLTFVLISAGSGSLYLYGMYWYYKIAATEQTQTYTDHHDSTQVH